MLRMSCRLELYILEYCLWWALKSRDKSEVLDSSHLVRKSSAAADKTQIAFLQVLKDLYCYTAAELPELFNSLQFNDPFLHLLKTYKTLVFSFQRVQKWNIGQQLW